MRFHMWSAMNYLYLFVLIWNFKILKDCQITFKTEVLTDRDNFLLERDNFL